MQQVNTLRVHVKEAETYYNQAKNILKQVEVNLVKEKLDPTSKANSAINVFQSPLALK